MDTLEALKGASNASALEWLSAALRQAERVHAVRDCDGGLLVTSTVLPLPGGRSARIGLRIAGYGANAGLGREAIAAELAALVAAEGEASATWAGPGSRVVGVSGASAPNCILVWIIDEDNPPPGAPPPAQA